MYLFLFVAPGNVTDHVIIERFSESTMMFIQGAKEAYLGYVALRVNISMIFQSQRDINFETL